MSAAAKDTKQWAIQISTSGDALKSALSSTPYVVFSGHSNMGLGPMFNVAPATSTSDFLNIGNPQAAINFPYMKEDEGFVNLNVADGEIPASSNNYWVLPNKLGANGVERFDNDDNIHPPAAIPFHARAGKPRNRGFHFNRDHGDDEYIIVDIPAAARTADLPKLGYKTFFYNACKTVRDYSEIFAANQGSVFIGSNISATGCWCDINDHTKITRIDKSNAIFAEKLMAGESWQAILDAINQEHVDLEDPANSFRIINF